MKKNKSIEQTMRRTTKANNNFIQEVKIMITKKGANNHDFPESQTNMADFMKK